MGWVEIGSAEQPQFQVSKDVRCKKCEDKAQASEQAEEEDAAFEVDECGLQIAIQQVREAESPEDAKAVLEALLRSSPTSELLEKGMWVEDAEGLMTVLDGQLKALTDKLLRLWGSRCSNTGGTKHSDMPVSESTAAIVFAGSGALASMAMGSDPAATTSDSVPVSPALSPVASISTADKKNEIAPNRGAASKNFLGPLLERARRRVQRNQNSPDKAANLIDNPHAEKKSTGNTGAFAEATTWPRPAPQMASVCIAPPAPSNVPRRPPHQGGQAVPHWTSIPWSGSPPAWCPPPPQLHAWSQPRFFLPSWPPPWRPHAQAPGVAWPRHALPH